MHLRNVSFRNIDPMLLPPIETKLSRTPRRMVSLLREGSRTEYDSASKSWSLDFLQSPHQFVGQEDTPELKQVDFLRNQFSNHEERFDPSASVKSLSEESMTSCTTKLAFRSIGYKSVAIPGMRELGMEFDESRGVIPNDYYGRISSSSKAGQSGGGISLNPLPGLYSAGWVKRGPAGVIANTMEDAFATAEAIASDWESKKPFLPGGEGWDYISSEALKRGLHAVSWSDWQKIDAAEKSHGKLKGKEREKFTRVQDMLSVLS